jgi:hypothetical protein
MGIRQTLPIFSAKQHTPKGSSKARFQRVEFEGLNVSGKLHFSELQTSMYSQPGSRIREAWAPPVASDEVMNDSVDTVPLAHNREWQESFRLRSIVDIHLEDGHWPPTVGISSSPQYYKFHTATQWRKNK